MATIADVGAPPEKRSADRQLDALNFFLADVRDGLGPYLAIYLLSVRGPAYGWNEATVGFVLTLSALIGLAAQTPAGGLVDRSLNKPRLLILAALAVTAASVSLPFVSGFVWVAGTQSLAAVAAALFAPGLSALTLGLVGPKMFARRVGRNEAFNHAGNAVAAGLAGLLAWRFGPEVVFWLMGALALASVAAAARVDNSQVDNRTARGLGGTDEAAEAPSGWRTLLECRPLLIFAALCAVFHLANAAMLPFVGQQLAREVGQDHATSLIALCIVAAQAVMVPVAMASGRLVERVGTKPLFVAAFAVLAVRGFLYPVFDAPAWLVGVQLLDGVGAGIFGALFPVVVADLTRGTGRFAVSQGAVATAQGLGAAFSAGLAGLIALHLGYGAMFATLGAIAAVGLVGYLLLMPETQPRSTAVAPAR